MLLTEPATEELLRVTGFEVVEKQYFRNDHSVFYATRKVESFNRLAVLCLNEYALYKNMFMSFVKAQQEAVSRITLHLSLCPPRHFYINDAILVFPTD